MTLFGIKSALFVAPLLVAIAGMERSIELSSVTPDAAVVDASFEDTAMMVSNCTYYNNAQHTQVVGQFGYDCCNNPVSWGRKTQFKECGGCFICFPPPP